MRGTWQWLVAVALAVPVAALGAGLPRMDGPITLQQAVSAALKHSPAIQAMAAEAVASARSARMVRAMSGLQVATHTTLSSGTMAGLVGSSQDVEPAANALTPSRAFANQDLSAMVPLYTGGRQQALVRAAASQARQADRTAETERSATALMVREAFYRGLLAGEMRKVAQARLDAASAMAANAQALVEAGRGIEATVQRARAEVADARRMVALAANDRSKMLLELKAAMGIDLASDLAPSGSLDVAPAAGSLAGSLERADRARPEVLAARAALEAAEAQVGAARGLQSPQVYGALMADAFSPADMGRNSGMTAAITVGLPLFDSGRRSAGIQMAGAMRDAARALLVRAGLQAEAEVRAAWVDADTAGANLAMARAALEAAEGAYQVISLRVEAQRSIQVEQLDALAALVQARANLAQAQFDRALAAARILRAEGGVE